MSSGKPLTALAANPVYNSPGEIPESVRGAGFDTIDGFLTRTPTQYDTAIHADYRLRVGRNEHVSLLADVFNLFNRQIPLDYDPNTETTFQVVESGLRAGEPLQPVAARDAAADQDWGAVPVLIARIHGCRGRSRCPRRSSQDAATVFGQGVQEFRSSENQKAPLISLSLELLF